MGSQRCESRPHETCEDVPKEQCKKVHKNVPHQVTRTVCPGDDGYPTGTTASTTSSGHGSSGNSKNLGSGSGSNDGPYSVHNDGTEDDEDYPIIDVRSSETSAATAGFTPAAITEASDSGFVWSG